MKLHVGQILKYKNNEDDQRKVLEILPNLVALSRIDNHDWFATWLTLTEIQETFEIPEEVWEPKEGMNYWYINNRGMPELSRWDGHEYDIDRKNFLGVYKTREDADKALEDYKIKLKK